MISLKQEWRCCGKLCCNYDQIYFLFFLFAFFLYFYVFSFSLSVAIVNLVIPYAFVFANVFKLIRDDNVKMWPPAPSPFSDSGKSVFILI